MLAAFDTLSSAKRCLASAWNLPSHTLVLPLHSTTTISPCPKGAALSKHAIRGSVLSFRHLRNRKYRLCNNWRCQFSDKSYQPNECYKFVPQFQTSEARGVLSEHSLRWCSKNSKMQTRLSAGEVLRYVRYKKKKSFLRGRRYLLFLNSQLKILLPFQNSTTYPVNY